MFITSIKMISEDEATGPGKEIYENIRETLGIDFVQNMYKAMEPKPDYLDATWSKVKAVMKGPGKFVQRAQ